MGTPSSTSSYTSKPLADFVTGSGVGLPAADEASFDAIVERALVNVSFLFREVSAPTLGNNGSVIFWPEELTRYQELKVFELHGVAREDDSIVYFVAEPARIIRVRAIPAMQGTRLVAQDVDEISRRDLYKELVQKDGDPLMTVLKSIRHLIFLLHNRVQKTERSLQHRLDRSQGFVDRYSITYSTD